MLDLFVQHVCWSVKLWALFVVSFDFWEFLNLHLKDTFLNDLNFIIFFLDYEKIFSLLEEVQGPMEMQKYFIEFAIKEAARFV